MTTPSKQAAVHPSKIEFIEFECLVAIARAAALFYCGWADKECMSAFLDTMLGCDPADCGPHN